ncbi:molybdate ABC transporter substrate-binding protein [Vibrio makurazakiensis]|uniref:molybdate ABC transporter substrate-binding protein n=1 Tax=Vibrio makurazakiensis TaxID=2910250 RepID=UPI003D10CC58
MKKLCTLLLASLSLVANAEDTLRVYAASSMTNAITELSNSYTEAQGVNIVTVFGGSSSLARQIERGAPVDVFISANQKWVDHLVIQDVISPSNVSIFASNNLTLIAPKASNISFDVTDKSAWETNLKDQRLAIGQPESVPAGIYAKEALSTLNVWDSVSHNLAPTKNVRVALVLVELGEAPLGIVYKTDAMASDKVRVVHNFSDTLHSEITYPLAKVNESDSVDAFITYLKSEPAKQILNAYGFK